MGPLADPPNLMGPFTEKILRLGNFTSHGGRSTTTGQFDGHAAHHAAQVQAGAGGNVPQTMKEKVAALKAKQAAQAKADAEKKAANFKPAAVGVMPKPDGTTGAMEYARNGRGNDRAIQDGLQVGGTARVYRGNGTVYEGRYEGRYGDRRLYIVRAEGQQFIMAHGSRVYVPGTEPWLQTTA